MKLQAITGPSAGSVKYDVLTMMTVAGLHGTPTFQTSMMRLAALVTARYNWRLDEFSVGQRDIAKMWSVNERTVKREMKRLTEASVLVCKRPGVRGRVGAYRLNYARLAEISKPTWSEVGPDFAYRMEERYNRISVNVVQLKTYANPSVQLTEGPWGHAMSKFRNEQPDIWNAWFSKLSFLDFENSILTIRAPNAFIQRYIETHLVKTLLDAVIPELGQIAQIEFQIAS